MSAEEPLLRLARAAVFATVCVVVSAAGHVFAGGGEVDPAVLAAGAAGALGLAYPLSGRERGPEVVLGTSIAAQILLHELFTRTSQPVATLLGSPHGHLTFGMLAVHVTVAMVTGWWLYRGESAVWLMLRLRAAAPLPLLRWLFAAGTRALPTAPPVVPASSPQPPPAWEIPAAIPRRGPPVPAVAG
ncbi:MFS transporter [Sphaerisporangium album]|uniref:MFS transporter n=1 Tax=Sphaerisporangium album TaxID=509200 RepID=A0A367FBG9_9ACTN|nr:MFS transporter [Sphaerisporangium album]RCG27037.1 MFS transporter [Sphaerisporangium album]